VCVDVNYNSPLDNPTEPLGIIVLYSRDIMVSWKRFPDVNVLLVEKRMKTKMA
jgi:hypothetical protein